MRLGPKITSAFALALAGLLAWFSATFAAGIIETRSYDAVRTALIEADHTWAEIHTDGLQVHIGGEAPTEAARFNALALSGQVVEASRVIDAATVTPATPIAPPRFSVEILRNDDGVQLIGLVPLSLDRNAMSEEIMALAEGATVTDFLETADYPVPAHWVQSLNFALDALARLPRSKISASAGFVSVNAISNSAEEKRTLETVLIRRKPDGVELRMDISAPRPVITPFTLRFLIDADGARFDACSADDARNRDRILDAARAAGLEGRSACTLGLGVPSPEWANAVILGIEALADLGTGTLTFSDADVALVAATGTDPARFDRVVGALDSNLPDVFSLKAVLPVAEEAPGDGPPPPEFTATRSPEGSVQLRGRLPNSTVHDMVESFARARFGVDQVYMAARQDAEGLPESWPIRVLAGLSALSYLDHGAVIVHQSDMSLKGVSGNQSARAEVARLLADKLGEDAEIALAVTYDEALDPLAALPTAQECIRKIEIILEGSKITFEPGSTDVLGESAEIVDQIADVLRSCRDVDMSVEIAGHTDSQGREQMNLELSEARARAVLDALAERRVLISKITSKGYGETVPIADNGTETGREANRRIEFRLIATAETPPQDTTGPSTTTPAAGDGTPSSEASAPPEMDSDTTETAE
ncbi:MAG: OmpA family protein [Pseudomonadota bacterium]